MHSTASYQSIWASDVHPGMRDCKAERGTNVVYLPGNHDEFARDFLHTVFGDISLNIVRLADRVAHTDSLRCRPAVGGDGQSTPNEGGSNDGAPDEGGRMFWDGSMPHIDVTPLFGSDA